MERILASVCALNQAAMYLQMTPTICLEDLFTKSYSLYFESAKFSLEAQNTTLIISYYADVRARHAKNKC